MTTTTTTHYGFELLANGQHQPELVINDALIAVDAELHTAAAASAAASAAAASASAAAAAATTAAAGAQITAELALLLAL